MPGMAPDFTVKELRFLLTLEIWKTWADRKMVELELEGTHEENISALLAEANKFEGVL